MPTAYCLRVNSSSTSSTILMQVTSQQYVIQVVNIDLPGNFEVESTQHIFLFEVPQFLGSNNYVAVIFGLHSYCLVHIYSHYSNPQSLGHQIIAPKQYQNILAGNQETLSFVKLAEVKESIIPFTNFPQQEFEFYLGSSHDQKVVQFKVQLRADQAQGMNSILTNCEEVLAHQQVKTLKSRLSTFISSKLYGTGENEGESAGYIKSIEIVQNFVFVVTSKDILIIRRSDNTKLYEREYFELAKQWAAEIDKNINANFMREQLDFRMLCTTSTLISNPLLILLTIVFVRKQAIQVPGSDQLQYKTELFQRTIHFMFDDTQSIIEEKDDKNSFYESYDISKLSQERVAKTFAISFGTLTNNNSNEIFLIIGAEFIDGRVFAIEHMISSGAQFLKQCNTQNLTGYSANIYKEQESNTPVVKLSFLTDSDIETYEYFGATSSLSQTDFQSLRQMLSNFHHVNYPLNQMPYQDDEPEQFRQVNIDQLRPFIFSLFEKVASYKFQQQMTAQEPNQQLDGEIQESLQVMVPQIGRTVFFNEIKEILEEAIDLRINDSHFSNLNNSMDSFQQVFQDDGLVQTSLESKQKKIEVISEFLFSYLISPEDSKQDQEDKILIQLINSLQFKLKTAQIFRGIQESKKEEVRQSSFRSESQFNRVTDYPIEMRLISKVIQNSASDLGFKEEDLKRMGVNSSNIVYSKISNFDQVISKMLEICLDTNPRLYIDMTSKETDQQMRLGASNILNCFLQELLNQYQQAIPSESFLNDHAYLNQLFKFAVEFSNGIKDNTQEMRQSFETLADNFMKIITQVNFNQSIIDQTWLVNLVVQLEKACGGEKALDFAETYGERKQLCILVFNLGRDKYEYIHRCVNKWGLAFLEIALETIYDQEKFAVKSKKQNYQFQMFEIFEEKYYFQLRQFIAPKNKKLLALLSLRHGESNEAHHLLKNEVIPSIQGVETMKVLSSIAVSNLENCVHMPDVKMKSEDANYLGSQLFIAETQSRVLPQEEMLILQITPQYLTEVLSNQSSNPEQRISTVFRLINEQRPDLSPAITRIVQQVRSKNPALLFQSTNKHIQQSFMMNITR